MVTVIFNSNLSWSDMILICFWGFLTFDSGPGPAAIVCEEKTRDLFTEDPAAAQRSFKSFER